jgi:hypothetical protein
VGIGHWTVDIAQRTEAVNSGQAVDSGHNSGKWTEGSGQ